MERALQENERKKNVTSLQGGKKVELRQCVLFYYFYYIAELDPSHCYRNDRNGSLQRLLGGEKQSQVEVKTTSNKTG